MCSTRRFRGVVGAFGFLVAGALLLTTHESAVPAGPDTFSRPISLPTDPDANGLMKAARDHIAEAQKLVDAGQADAASSEWAQACRALQGLLNYPKDGFVQPVPSLWVGTRYEANRLLATMPTAGLTQYERMVGGLAAASLKNAQEDPQRLAKIVQQYFHTKAGATAAELLGTYWLERNKPMMAAAYFDRLLTGPRGGELEDQVVIKAALAFYLAGDKTAGDEARALLQARAERDGRLQLGNQRVPITHIKEVLDQARRQGASLDGVWGYYRGTPGRNGQGGGGPFSGAPLWVASTVQPPVDGGGEAKLWAETMIGTGVRQIELKGMPALPAFQPIVIPGQVIYRTYNGVYASYLKDREIVVKGGREQKKAGDYAWWTHTDGGLFSLGCEPTRKGVIDGWRTQYNQWGSSNAIFENSLAGTLSTDGTRVFAIDDLFIQPHPQQLRNGQRNFGALQSQVVERNTLKAYSIELDGSILWELGGDYDPHADPERGTKNSFFLGPPLPLADKLYVLNEKDGIIRLICLQCKDRNERRPPPPDIVWVKTLASAKENFNFDFNRRMHAAHLAYGNGFVICPTNAGTIIGVDLVTHGIWAYQYRAPGTADQKPVVNPRAQPPANYLVNEWRATAPAIHDDTVVFAAPDSPTIHSVSLRDGRAVWTKPRADDDLYFAGIFADKVLIVGKSYVHALSMASGEEVWKLGNTGTPSGQGTASDNIYYLPVRASAEPGQEPGVVAINVSKGKVSGFTKAVPKDGAVEIPGNLIFHEGQLLSQNLTSLVCYPLLPKGGD